MMAGAPKGNQNSHNGRKWAGAIRRALHDRDALQHIANKVVEMALEGDPWAIKEIGDRLDGKPAQSVTVDGDGEGGAIKHALEVRFADG